MSQIEASLRAGTALRKLIQQNYTTQEEFALEYGLEIRTLSRYVNHGITKVDTIQELASFFGVSIFYFLQENQEKGE